LKLNLLQDGMAAVRITDMMGRAILTQNNRVSAGTNAITFSNISHIATGTYNVQVLINGKVLNQKLIISK